MLNQTLKLVSTKEVLDNPQIMETTPTQHLTLSEISSLTPTPVLANGGRFNSTNNTGLTESRFSTEETAVEIDSQVSRCSLTTNSVDKYQVVPETDSGTK